MQSRTRTFNGQKFKLLGLLTCKPCVEKWKQTLHKKGKLYRIVKTKAGYEVYVR